MTAGRKRRDAVAGATDNPKANADSRPASDPGQELAAGSAPGPVQEAAAAAGGGDEIAGGERAGAVVEPLDQAVDRLERETAEWKDRALRAAADLDNYRKRVAREREESASRGQLELLAKVLEVVDDLARVARLDPAQTTAETLHEGMGLVERKFLRVLEAAGVERLDPAGQPFDPHSHEAVVSLPAPTAEQDHTVAAVYQHGYRLRGALLRPARVAVYQWTAPTEPGSSGDGGQPGAAAS